MPPHAKHKKYVAKAKTGKKDHGWMVVGFDTSMSSISGAAFAYDKTLKRAQGPVFSTVRWNSPEDDYFDRIKAAANSHEIIWDLQSRLKVVMEMDEIFIAQEEPWPFGMKVGRTSAFFKQQAEMSGAFLGGLVKWGYPNIVQINVTRWRQMIAAELGISIHHSKWRDPELALKFNCRPADSGKFRAKQWAMEKFEIPDLPDIIETRGGKRPRPEGSKAKAVQPADEYDALAVAWTFAIELAENGILKPSLDETVPGMLS